MPRRADGTRLSRMRVWLIAPAAAAALFLLWPGCSVKKNYKVLSFFFDGVPDPNAPRLAAAEGSFGSGELRASPTYSIHRPFADDQCTACHTSRFRLEPMGAEVCMKCHAQTIDEFPRMHGPVAAGACLWCHTPHESAFPVLLRAEARRVCTQCHEPGMLDILRIPAHADEARSCLECHTGHGGHTPSFIRPGMPGSGVPATEPAEPADERVPGAGGGG